MSAELNAAEVRCLARLESWRLAGRDHGITARALAYEEEGGAEDGRGARNRTRARLYRLRAMGLVWRRHFPTRGAARPSVLLGWVTSPAGREALREGCPYCKGRREAGEAYPYGHHKPSCYRPEGLEPSLRLFVASEEEEER